ncbi:cystathionine beta-lyase [Hydrogenophaga sp. BPS33]|uniref:cystathionine beta-lyase n=1 Tax=Hydrogenophaga sp. BPS33 TaxID=2651974 RepID=UPI00131F9C6D|nr:cystathionine beta-lyase [Hydrogenophaga sp. BPS33]QHE84485.1 cystathionine beta-lyase [Hydrogenophaga sp. BPS33]
MSRPQPATLVTHGGRPQGARVTVNPPVARTSTVVFDSMATLQKALAERTRHERGLLYGRKGSSTGDALEDVLTALEGGHRTRLFGSGLAAISCTLLACVRPGDHVLVIDSCYDPVRRLCAQYLEPMGVAVDFFRPDLSDFAAQIRPETRLVWAECPGTLLYEMCDLPALVALTRQHGHITVAVDNTWGSGLLYHPLALGADISVVAGTKYLVGHSDVMLGAVTTREPGAFHRVADMADLLGHSVSPDDAYLALRGVRTLTVRLRQHQANALTVAQWLQQQAAVRTVFYPALPEDPGHALWQRDCNGANGLVSIEFQPTVSEAQTHAFVNALQWFGIGHSWGGYESLALPMRPARALEGSDWPGRGQLVRLHIGLEDSGDLIADLAQALVLVSA